MTFVSCCTCPETMRFSYLSVAGSLSCRCECGVCALATEIPAVFPLGQGKVTAEHGAHTSRVLTLQPAKRIWMY